MDAMKQLSTRQLVEIQGSLDELVDLYRKAIGTSNSHLADVAENAAALMGAAESSTVRAQRWMEIAASVGGASESAAFVPTEWAAKDLVQADGDISRARFLKEFVSRSVG